MQAGNNRYRPVGETGTYPVPVFRVINSFNEMWPLGRKHGTFGIVKSSFLLGELNFEIVRGRFACSTVLESYWNGQVQVILLK